MGGKSGKPTIGYWYEMDVLATACAAADQILEFKFADRSGWVGSVTESSTISIYREDLFGGAEREGGVYGQVDIMLGEDDLPVNEFLGSSMRLSGISGPVPAYRNSVNFFFRGIAGLTSEFDPSGVFVAEAEVAPIDTSRGPTFGSLKPKTQPKAFRWSAMNPYFKPFKVKLRRHFMGWHPELSKITPTPAPDDIPYSANWWWCQFDHLVADGEIHPELKMPPPVGGGGYTWSEGPGPFGWNSSGTYTTMLPNYGDVASWFIKTITVPAGITRVEFIGTAENAGYLYIDGVYVYSNNVNNIQSNVVLPMNYTASLAPGDHTIAVFLTNEFYGGPVAPTDVIEFKLKIVFGVGVYANGAHIILEALTDKVWGLGWPISDIDDDSFTEVAETLFDEGFALSFKWSETTSIEDFIMLVLRHINGVLYQDRATGKLKLKLIRSDYDTGSLVELNPSNSNLESLSRAANGEIVNEINLTYRTADNIMSTITLHDLASIQTQGQVISQDVEMIGIRTADLAARVAQRELESRVKPIAKLTITTNRIGYNLHEGGVFKLSWPDHGIAAMVCRIIAIDLGTLTDNSIRIEAVQDVFGLPSTSYVKPQNSNWVDPNSAAQPSPLRYITETPYYILARSLSDADLPYLDATDCYIAVLATEPSADALDFNLWTAVDGNQLTNGATGTHAAHTKLTAIAPMEETSVLQVSNAREIVYLIETDSACVVIGDEYAKIVDYNLDTNTITVDRGSLDTTIATHAIDADVLLYDSNAGQDEVSYLPTEVVSVKVQTRTAKGILPLGAAPTDLYTVNQRQARPYPPGKVRVNSLVYPDTIGLTDGLQLTWAHRNRLTQTAGITGQYESTITPEVGTTYNVRIYGELNSLLRSVSALTTESYDYTTLMEQSDMGSIGGGSAIDQSWDKTVFLANANGTNGSTVFIDSSPNFAIPNGNVHVTTSQLLFGTSVATFDGTGDYLNLPYVPNYDIGSANCTIEYWFRPVSVSVGQVHFDWRDAAATKGVVIYQSSANPNKLTASVGDSNTAAYEVIITGTTTLVVGTLYHARLVKNGTNWQLYLNGATQGSATSSVVPYLNSAAIFFGAARDATTGFNGQAADLRVTKAARNTSGFTAPTERFSRYSKPADFSQTYLLLTAEPDSADQYDGEPNLIFNRALENLTSGGYYASGQNTYFRAKKIDTDSKFGTRCFTDGNMYERDEFNVHLTAAKKITFDFWAKIPSTITDSLYYHYLFRSYNRWGIIFVKNGGSSPVSMSFSKFTAGSPSSTMLSLSGTSDLDTWVHYAVVLEMIDYGLDTATVTVYRGGVQVGSGVVPYSDIVGVTEPRLGDDYPEYGKPMLFDEFRIRHGAAYTANFTPPASSINPQDPYWANTVVLIPMSGHDNSTQFENIAEIVKLPSSIVGGASISTSQSKFGGSSAYFDGSGDHFAFTHIANRWALLSDFTIQCWIYPTATPVSKNIISKGFAAGSILPHWSITTDGSGKILAQLGRSQVSASRHLLYSTGATAANVWTHVAFVRTGNTLKLFINGIQDGADVTVSITPLDSNAAGLYVGNASGAAAGDSWAGYIDDIGVVNGYCKYTANFTPPITELGKYVPALNSQLTFELESERDGLVSWQKHRHTVTRT